LCRDLEPKVVVLDNRMPTMTGVEVARLIKSEFDDDIDIVLFSAYLDDRVIEEALDAGVSDVLSKSELLRLPEVLRRLRPAC